MNILVYDVAAEDGGGLFVLNNFYNDIVKISRKDIHWTFVVSKQCIESTANVEVLVFDKPKKSWFHRLVFEYITFPKALNDLKPDLLISLQNMPVKNYKGRQFVYLHQSLQYCPKKFSFLKKDERSLAIRQRIICEIFKKALPAAEHIFVQTKWMQEATMHWLNVGEEKITVIPVSMSKPDFILESYSGLEERAFFYPARPEIYKNHQVIIDACKILLSRGINDFKVIFTFTSDDGAFASTLYKQTFGLPIECVGTMPLQEVWKLYKKTVLLFPSYLETCGLPLLEAKVSGGFVIASDMPFSHEALDGYPNTLYFPFNSPEKLADCMEKLLKEKPYISVNYPVDSGCGLAETMLKRLELK